MGTSSYPRPISQTARTTTAATASPSTPNAMFQTREPSRCLCANKAGIHKAAITGGRAKYIERGKSLIAHSVASRIVEIPAMISWFLRACDRVNSGATISSMGEGRVNRLEERFTPDDTGYVLHRYNGYQPDKKCKSNKVNESFTFW